MKARIKVAVIGCGRFAKNFIPLFKAHPAVEKVFDWRKYLKENFEEQ